MKQKIRGIASFACFVQDSPEQGISDYEEIRKPTMAKSASHPA